MLRSVVVLAPMGFLILAAAFASPVDRWFGADGTEMTIEQGEGTPNHYLFEITRGRSGLFSRRHPVGVRLSVDGPQSFHALSLLVGQDNDHDGVVRFAEWRVIRCVQPVVVGGVTTGVIDPVLVDESNGSLRVVWVNPDGTLMSEEWSSAGLTVEDPSALVQ